MSEDEFWRTTPAKIISLYHAHEAVDKRRDFFVAQLVACQLNKGLKEGDKALTGLDVLGWQHYGGDKEDDVFNTTFNDALGSFCSDADREGMEIRFGKPGT